MSRSHLSLPGTVKPIRFFPVYLIVPLLMLGWITLPAAHAQEASATASVSDTNVEPGQPVTYQIQFNGGQPSRPPAAPQVEGLTITYVGESTNVQMRSTNNGGIQFISTRIYNYSVETDRAGRYLIPGQEIVVGAKTVRVLPVEFNVAGDSGAAAGNGTSARNSDQAAFVRLILPKKTAYVGESIPVEVRCYLGLRLRPESDFNAALDGEGFSSQKFTPPQTDSETIDGVRYNVVKTSSSVTALKTGEISLGPVQVQMTIQRPRPQTRGRQRGFNSSPFDQFFNDPAQMPITRTERLQSDPQKLEVKPLPPGAPEDFEGAIGQFRLDVAAQGNPRKIQTGDPVTLIASLQGMGNFDRVQAPALTDENGLQTYPASSKFKGDDDVHFRGIKTFEQVVIPRAARTSVPGYHLSYLDPNTGKYVKLETPPITLKIEGNAPTPPPTAGPASGAVSTRPSASPTPAAKAEDILYIRNDLGTVAGSDGFVPLYRHRGFWLAQLAPLAGLLVLAALAWQAARTRSDTRRRVVELHRLQSELARTLRGEKTGRRDFYTAATRLARLKAVTPANQENSETLTAEEVSRAKSLDSDTASSLEAIFHRYDELSYSGERTAQEPVPAYERKNVLATVDKL